MQSQPAHRCADLNGDRRAELFARLQSWERQIVEPVEIDESAYDRAREAFVVATVDHPDVVAVYGDSVTPTVPGISDLDLALVVADRIDRFAELQASVDSVLHEFSAVFSHPPIIVPESVFERLPLIANNTMSFDHLGGQCFKPVEPDEVAHTLRFFDRLAYKPFGYLISDLYPLRYRPLDSRVPRSIAGLIEATVRPMVAATSDYSPSADTLRIKKSRILSKVAGLQHDRDRFVRATGASPEVDSEVLDRVKQYRQRHFDDPVTAEECLELLLDGLYYRYHLYREFIDRQMIYPESDRTFYLRRNVPTVATPAWDGLPPDRMLHLFYESGIRGRILPSETALHTATLPRGDELFYKTAPDPEVEATVTVKQRNETIRQYLEFVEFHRDHDGFHDTFKLVPVGEFIQNATSGSLSSDTVSDLIGRRIRGLRNRFVANRWHRLTRDTHLDP